MFQFRQSHGFCPYSFIEEDLPRLKKELQAYLTTRIFRRGDKFEIDGEEYIIGRVENLCGLVSLYNGNQFAGSAPGISITFSESEFRVMCGSRGSGEDFEKIVASKH